MYLEIENLKKKWPALDIQVSISLEKGKLMALLGPSGCGKSTILNLIAGIEALDSGSLRLDGAEISDLAPRDRKIGMVFQDYALFPHLSVEDNIAFGLIIRNLSRREARAKANDFLARIGLEGFGKRRVSELSGGERQRVALARTLIVNPSLLLLDEPLSALDASLRLQLREEIKALQTSLGFTTIYVTHDREEAFAVADVVAIMHKGKIIGKGSPSELWNNPCDSRIASFLRSGCLIPALDVKRIPHDSSASKPGFLKVQTQIGSFACMCPPRLRHELESVHPLHHPFMFFHGDSASILPQDQDNRPNSFSAYCSAVDFAGFSWHSRFIAQGIEMTLSTNRNSKNESIPEAGKNYQLFIDPSLCMILETGE